MLRFSFGLEVKDHPEDCWIEVKDKEAKARPAICPWQYLATRDEAHLFPFEE